jgi:hypothetical protein
MKLFSNTGLIAFSEIFKSNTQKGNSGVTVFDQESYKTTADDPQFLYCNEPPSFRTELKPIK